LARQTHSPPSSPSGAPTCAVTRARSRSPAGVRTTREAHEEIGLDPARVELVGALPPVGTFVTGYRIFPFVGLIEPGQSWRPQATEVEQVLEFTLADLMRGHEMQRLIRKGVPIKTPTYTVNGHLVWGATARIVQSLLERLGPIL
jgi:hypothetical protein